MNRIGHRSLMRLNRTIEAYVRKISLDNCPSLFSVLRSFGKRCCRPKSPSLRSGLLLGCQGNGPVPSRIRIREDSVRRLLRTRRIECMVKRPLALGIIGFRADEWGYSYRQL